MAGPSWRYHLCGRETNAGEMLLHCIVPILLGISSFVVQLHSNLRAQERTIITLPHNEAMPSSYLDIPLMYYFRLSSCSWHCLQMEANVIQKKFWFFFLDRAESIYFFSLSQLPRWSKGIIILTSYKVLLISVWYQNNTCEALARRKHCTNAKCYH